jgi:hypothetical protein
MYSCKKCHFYTGDIYSKYCRKCRVDRADSTKYKPSRWEPIPSIDECNGMTIAYESNLMGLPKSFIPGVGPEAETAGTQRTKVNHELLAQDIGAKVDRKSEAYNAGGKDAVAKMADILKIHFPDGVKPEQYRDLCLIVRIEDKICRIASGNKKAFNESPYDDITGYGLRGAMLDREEDMEKKIGQMY